VTLKRSELSVGQALPTLATELEALLRAASEIELADTVPDLPIVDRCRCGDDFCATIYMVRPPQGPWGPEHYTLPLRPRTGYLNVDVLDGKIVELEILFRDEIRQRVLELLP
jgi:hypothetical protein